jgi:hypothetical protein
MPTRANIIEEIVALDTDEIEEVRDDINKILIEKKRQQYLNQFHQSLADSKSGILFTSNNIDEITKWLMQK